MITVSITEFAKRQLKSDFGGTKVDEVQVANCEVESIYALNCAIKSKNIIIKDGYADFCKIVCIDCLVAWPNVSFPLSPIVLITAENEKFIRCRYEARREGELPVLIRYMPFGCAERHPAHHLNIILYSRKQLNKEAIVSKEKPFEYDWGIVAINAEPNESDSPMTPATILRNALGVEFGGSGVKLNVANYLKSVEYWSKYAQIE